MVKINRNLIDIWRLIRLIVITFMLLACSTEENTAKNIYHMYAVGSRSPDNLSRKIYQKKFEKIVRNLDVKCSIMDQYFKWKGVRYRFGGSTKKGIDCSAFVQRTFREQFGLELPRSTYKQQKIGKSISRSSLCTGDLVWFRTAGSRRHVGIYIDNNRFIHASTRNGVMISSMNEPYWKKHYKEARRVL